MRGAPTPTQAPTLAAGGVYRDAVPAGGTRVYRLDLDDRSGAYVSAVAVPPPTARVGIAEGVAVSIRDPGGRVCGSREARFGTAAFPRPLAASAGRTGTEGASACRRAGTYLAVVERLGGEGGVAGAGDWQVELRYEREPALRGGVPSGAGEGSSAPVDGNEGDGGSDAGPGGGEPGVRVGGGGFSEAAALASGEWDDRIEPGQSRFYRVPVDWGQRVSARVAGGALAVTLYNPVQGMVAAAETVAASPGRPMAAELPVLPPVRYENRYGGESPDGRARPGDVRFAGWYYLVVSARPETAGTGRYGLRLSVRVTGAARPGPGYEGPPGVFTVTDADRRAAAPATAAPASSAAGRPGMRLLATAAFGTGTALLVGLAGWTLIARRRARGAH
ncbi:hypothetical protein [Streptomyces lichenis]|uniref:Uncharacterized protein n=1 Tax=Streptomyces lichenis TaxID=2306967 RepID=A0ABT0I4N9_9ACTN|nr:hypothetical protein [Streptomyces lichenis]MCK8676278.1 hypothetical protein [Streptomyces lichenis]